MWSVRELLEGIAQKLDSSICAFGKSIWPISAV
jgi:hypothetical protein